MEHFVWAFYIALPAFGANMIPVFAARFGWLASLNWPLDGGKTLRGRPILGTHKTARGMVVGTGFGFLIGGMQYALHVSGLVVVDIPLDALWLPVIGALGACGALVGDSIKSFIKRQVGVKSGGSFVPFDQIDYILGFLAVTHWAYGWTWEQAAFLLLCGLVLNPIVNITSYFAGIKDTWT